MREKWFFFLLFFSFFHLYQVYIVASNIPINAFCNSKDGNDGRVNSKMILLNDIIYIV